MINHYKDIPFPLTECRNCGLELPQWEKLCGECVNNLQEEDLLNHQRALCYKYLPKYKSMKHD